jgi:hypothetical protein
MPGGDGSKGTADEGFHKPLAGWHLGLCAEVARTSSLPTGMFDASDPMLEMQLADSAEVMFASMPEAPGVDGAQKSRLRLEQVSADELRSLPSRVSMACPSGLDLRSGMFVEYLGILADTASSGPELSRDGVAHLLERDFGLGADAEAPALASAVAEQVRETLAAGCATPATDEALNAACRALAAAIAGARNK